MQIKLAKHSCGEAPSEDIYLQANRPDLVTALFAKQAAGRSAYADKDSLTQTGAQQKKEAKHVADEASAEISRLVQNLSKLPV